MTIEEYLKVNDITVVTLSERSGVAREPLRRYLLGKTGLSLESIERLKKVGIHEPYVKPKTKSGLLGRVKSAPEGTLARYLLDNKISVKDFSEISKLSIPVIHRCLKGHSISPNSQRKMAEFGIVNFGEDAVHKEKKKSQLNNAGRPKHKDSCLVTDTIKYMIELGSGVAYLKKQSQVSNVAEWAESRGYVLRVEKTDKGDFEIKFRKVEK